MLAKSVLEKLGFYILSSLNYGRGSAGGILLTQHFPEFLFKNHAPVSFIQIKNNNNLTPVITIIGVPFIVITFEVNRVFKQRRF